MSEQLSPWYPAGHAAIKIQNHWPDVKIISWTLILPVFDYQIMKNVSFNICPKAGLKYSTILYDTHK